MGKCWLETTGGRLIYLPVQGDDINTPDEAQRIPTSIIVNRNRCFDGQIQVVSPTHGTITFDFSAPGRTGTCNQCGQCCGHPADSCPDSGGNCGYILHEDLNWHVCQYLVIDKWRKFGQEDNTSCSIYTDLLDTFKGCMYPLMSADEILPHMTSCGYSFGS